MYRPDHNTANYSGTINSMELPPLRKFCRQRENFESLDRETLWKLLRHYGVPMKFVNLIRNSYEGLSCRVVHEGQLTEKFEVKTGVRQGCLLSSFLFILAIDWIMRAVTNQKRNGIQLDDLDFADDLALLSHNHQQDAGKNIRPASHLSANRADAK